MITDNMEREFMEKGERRRGGKSRFRGEGRYQVKKRTLTLHDL